jgi:hypothetical protein
MNRPTLKFDRFARAFWDHHRECGGALAKESSDDGERLVVTLTCETCHTTLSESFGRDERLDAAAIDERVDAAQRHSLH